MHWFEHRLATRASQVVRLWTVLVVFVLSSSGQPRLPSGKAAAATELQAWIEHEFDASRAVSLTVAVGQDGRLLWSRSWGYADKERRIRATPQTMYSLASVSKSITATALMTLVERGAIDLDAPIDRYLGGLALRAYAGEARNATVRRVASHTAGLPEYQDFFFADENRSPQPMAEAIRRYGLIVRPPGERFIYSNLGYGILGYAIAQVSGQEYDAYVRREVFSPLGMTRSAVGMPSAPAAFLTGAPTARDAIRYAGDGVRLPPYEADTIAASSLYASAEDLVRFGFLHVKAIAPGQRKILRDASIDLMQQRIPPSPFGMGWQVLDGPASGVVFHSGGMDGAAAIVFLVPAKRLVVVSVCSSKVNLPARAASEIVNRMVPGVTIDVDKSPLPPPHSGPIPESLSGDWTGEVRAHNGAHVFRLSIRPYGTLEGRLDDQPRRVIEGVEYIDDELRGSLVSSSLGTGDVRQPYRLRFSLHAGDADHLTGTISAWSFREGRGPDILPSYLTLHRIVGRAHGV